MAYPTISGPYGLVPVNLIGGRAFVGSTRMVPIRSGYSEHISFGDVVQIDTATGTLVRSAVGTPGATQAVVNGTLGVFLGCEYSSSTGPIYGKNRYQNWAANTVAADAIAYVADDPQQVFKAVALTNTGSASNKVQAAFGQIFLGSNLELVTNYTSNTLAAPTSGNSSGGLCAGSSNAKVTAAAPFRVVGFVNETALSVTTSIPSTVTNATQTPASMTGIYPGMQVSGSGITTPVYVQTVTSSTFTVNSSFTSAAGTNYTFTGAQEVLVAWNFGHHSYANGTGV